MAAARRLFAKHGVEDVTMDEIAQAAGVGKGALYRRHADKGELVLALMDTCVGQLDADMQQLVCPAPEAGISALGHLEAVLIHLAEWIEVHAAELGVISHSSGDGGAKLYSNPLYTWLHGVLVDLLQRAVAQGEAEVADAVYAADVLLAALQVDLYLFQRHQRNYTAAQIQAGLRQLVSGFRRRPAVARPGHDHDHGL